MKLPTANQRDLPISKSPSFAIAEATIHQISFIVTNPRDEMIVCEEAIICLLR